ncbi:MAG TPA: hypothetical protein VN777_15460 [Terriglobales bacterium]|nr:hypothetical protein [Terriglobales bacterium]HZW93074.1 hypothetical protein [Candidatus Eremiobacteraceae bacterium]
MNEKYAKEEPGNADRFGVFRHPDQYASDPARMNSPYRPIGNFLFLGSTGPGKTQLVEPIETVVGDVHTLVKGGFGKSQQGHEKASVIDTPPGYTGHREVRPMLSQTGSTQYHAERIKQGFALFGGVKKRSDALHNLLLDVLDRVTLTVGAKIGEWISLTP